LIDNHREVYVLELTIKINYFELAQYRL